ncbi:class I SAM-dependent methyltransferase [Alkalihalobacillus sp. BA299]|uniref:class I SAM-dependent methyltransferase n=1 Tax=Alkalihalobacillus sp. BA299 TaxID=2815938 RepID=UPI001ADA791D|nr:class I SAM-dependent methyltransferase [Alkalihalobacillus sp. BA299]
MNAKEKEQIKGLLKDIKAESKDMRNVLWSREEMMENKDFINSVNLNMEKMMDHIMNSLYQYQKIGWKKFLPNKELIEQKEQDERIKKEKERFMKWIERVTEIDDFYYLFHRQLAEEKLLKTLSDYGCDDFQKASVMDIGCRDGKWLKSFQEWGALPGNLVGIDVYQPIINQAKKISDSSIQFMEIYPDELPFEDKKFDVILMFGFLMHVLDESLRKKIGREIVRVLSDDGIIITFNLTKDAIASLEPFYAYTSIGLESEDLIDIFTGCSVHFERQSHSGLAIIRKKKL